MSSSSTIRRLATASAFSALVVASTGCGTQSNPLASTDPVPDPMTSSETQVATQASTSFSARANATADCTEIAIKITPTTLVLHANGTWVTVHADVRYDVVDTETIQLEGVDAFRSFRDEDANLVSQFKQKKIKEVVQPGRPTLVLTGSYVDGGTFRGEDDIWVRR